MPDQQAQLLADFRALLALSPLKVRRLFSPTFGRLAKSLGLDFALVADLFVDKRVLPARYEVVSTGRSPTAGWDNPMLALDAAACLELPLDKFYRALARVPVGLWYTPRRLYVSDGLSESRSARRLKSELESGSSKPPRLPPGPPRVVNRSSANLVTGRGVVAR